MKYEKKFYTLSEAAEKLSVSENDLTLEAAAGRLLVCFFYRGYLGIYSEQKEQQQPVCYFDGFLRSLERVSLGRKSERHTEFESIYTTADECRARLVNVAQNLTNQPDPPKLTDNRHYTRLGPDGSQLNSHVDESEWRFHIDDLQALLKPENGDLLAIDKSTTDDPSPPTGEIRLVKARKQGITKAEILAAEWPIPKNAPRLDDILDKIPKWVEEACTKVGRRGNGVSGSHLWNPAMLAVCLATPTPHKRWLCNKTALTNFIKREFSEYFEEWNDNSGFL